MFLHEEEICDRQLDEKIFDKTAKLQQTENDALFGDDRHTALQQLTEYLRNFNYAIGKEQIERTRAHVEKTLAKQTRNKEQIAKLSRVQLEQGGNGILSY